MPIGHNIMHIVPIMPNMPIMQINNRIINKTK